MVLLKNQVLLLKTKSEDTVDKYEEALKSHNLKVDLIKTLVFDFENIDILANKLRKSEEYSGIIFSSPRCVEAVYLAHKHGVELNEWSSKDNFAVGQTTAKESYDKLKLNCLGKDSGAAANLVKLIIQDKSKYKKPFLYPHGSLKTDTITNELSKESIVLDSILVYNTKDNQNIEADIKIATRSFDDIPEFVVFFSPSGVRCALKHLKSAKDFSASKLIAIGATTEAALKEEGVKVYGVAKHPTPQDILDIFLER